MGERRIAFMGAPFSFSEAAVRALHGQQVTPVPHPTFAQVLEAVRGGVVDGGVLPVDNTRAGPVGEVHALLEQASFALVAGVDLRVEQCLLGLPGARLEGVREARSHPVALAQCARFLSGRGIARVETADTSTSALEVARAGRPELASIASRRAGEAAGLVVLAEGIQDDAENRTRFVAVARAPLPAEPAHPGRTLRTWLAFRPRPDSPAAQQAFSALAIPGCVLSRIALRPGQGWQRWVHLDLDVPPDLSVELAGAIAQLSAHCAEVRLFGTFPVLPEA